MDLAALHFASYGTARESRSSTTSECTAEPIRSSADTEEPSEPSAHTAAELAAVKQRSRHMSCSMSRDPATKEVFSS